MRRVLLATLFTLAACGGDSSGPSHAFPDVAGTYNVQGSFNDIPTSSASFSGTITLTQASRDAATLAGNSNITANLDGSIFVFANALQNASITPAGVLSFLISDASGSWSFTGNVSANAISNGQHTLTDGSTTLNGTWTGSKASSSVQARNQSTGATAAALLRALKR